MGFTRGGGAGGGNVILPPDSVFLGDAANEAEMVAYINAKVGEYVRRTDLDNVFYILAGADPTLSENWVEFSGALIRAVTNGLTAQNGIAKIGGLLVDSNTQITGQQSNTNQTFQIGIAAANGKVANIFLNGDYQRFFARDLIRLQARPSIFGGTGATAKNQGAIDITPQKIMLFAANDGDTIPGQKNYLEITHTEAIFNRVARYFAVSAAPITQDFHITHKKYVDDAINDLASAIAQDLSVLEYVFGSGLTEDNAAVKLGGVVNQTTKFIPDGVIDFFIGKGYEDDNIPLLFRKISEWALTKETTIDQNGNLDIYFNTASGAFLRYRFQQNQATFYRKIQYNGVDETTPNDADLVSFAKVKAMLSYNAVIFANWAGKFDKNYVIGSFDNPISDDITTLDFTGALEGATVLIFHNSSSNPLLFTHVKSFASEYSLNTVNIIQITNFGGSPFLQIDQLVESVYVPIVSNPNPDLILSFVDANSNGIVDNMLGNSPNANITYSMPSGANGFVGAYQRLEVTGASSTTGFYFINLNDLINDGGVYLEPNTEYEVILRYRSSHDFRFRANADAQLISGNSSGTLISTNTRLQLPANTGNAIEVTMDMLSNLSSVTSRPEVSFNSSQSVGAWFEFQMELRKKVV